MLFMGSEKYSDENEYDSFLAKHGGSSNAYTEMVRPLPCMFLMLHLQVGVAETTGAYPFSDLCSEQAIDGLSK